VSTTQDNLPAVPEKPPVPTVIGTLWDVALWVAKRELLMRVVMVAVLVALGAAGVVYGQDKFDAGIAPLREELAADRKANAEVHKRQSLEREQDRADLATTKMQSAETMLNVRMLVERLNMKPIVLVNEQDAGR
jgi:hypothetical protein